MHRPLTAVCHEAYQSVGESVLSERDARLSTEAMLPGALPRAASRPDRDSTRFESDQAAAILPRVVGGPVGRSFMISVVPCFPSAKYLAGGEHAQEGSERQDADGAVLELGLATVHTVGGRENAGREQFLEGGGVFGTPRG